MYIDKLGFDPDTVPTLSFGELLKRIGPGIILTGVVIGPGAITTASMLGANYGYQMLWLFIPIFIMGITFMLSCYRICMLTGMPIIHAIRHYYGKGAAAFVGICLFFSCLFFTFGNISGSGAGMNLIFGINWKVGALIMIAILLLMYFSKNTYSKVEKGVLLCIMGMIIAFYATLIASGGPAAGPFFTGITHWQFPQGSLYFTHSLSSVLTPPSLPAFTEPIWEQKRNGRKKTSLTAPCLLTALPMSLQLFSFLEPSLRLVLSSFTRQASKSRHRPRWRPC